MRNNRLLCGCRAALGALAFLPIGYLLFAVNSLNGNDGSYSMSNWLLREPTSAFSWAFFGVVMGCLWHAIARLNSN
jgi:hypothetical protein